MLGNTAGWITYSILIQDLFVFFGNAPGFLMAFWLNLQAAKMQYETFRSQEIRKSIIRELENASSRAAVEMPADQQPGDKEDPERQQSTGGLSETARIVWNVVAQKTVAPAPHETLVLANVVVWLALIALICFASAFSGRTKELIVGISVNLNLVVFYGAPLSTIFTVLKTKSSSSIHIRTMLTNTFNGIFWAAYGFAITDLFIAVPNSLGAGLGFVQILLCLFFPRNSDTTRPAEDESGEPTPIPRVEASKMELEQTSNEA